MKTIAKLLLLLISLTVLALIVLNQERPVTAQGGDQKTTRVSIASDGTQGNFSSFNPTISANGRYVAFRSSANNLVISDTNGYWDIFVRDRHLTQTTRISVASDGTQANGRSLDSSISADGRYVAFDSDASNLVISDTNGYSDIFVRDRQTSQTTRVSVASDGTQADWTSDAPSISTDGRYVAFDSDARNLVIGDTNGYNDIFVHDRQTGQTTRVSVVSNGTQANGNSFAPSISADGRYVAFQSDASNLVTADTNLYSDIFVHDRQTDQTTRVSVASDGTQRYGGSEGPSISADGRYVAFASRGNLVIGDANFYSDIFVHDRQTGQTTRVSVASDGTQANDDSLSPFISADGQSVAFDSYSTNLVVGDTNGQVDIFVHDGNGNPPPQPDLPPVIFLPGIAGSRLVDTTDGAFTELWLGLGQNHAKLSLYPSSEGNGRVIFANDVIRRPFYGPLFEFLTQQGYVEYQVRDDPALRGPNCRSKEDQQARKPTLFVFAYDWRLDNARNAELLADYIKCVRSYYPDRKVALLAHSMGGLIARRYIMETPNAPISTLITMGSPWLGAPKAIYAQETGDLDIPQLVVSHSTIKSMIGSFNGASQLIPSRAYYDMAKAAHYLLPFREEGWDVNGNKQDNEMYEYEDLISMLDTRYGREVFLPGSVGKAFHEKNGQDNWSNTVDTISYYHLIGIQK